MNTCLRLACRFSKKKVPNLMNLFKQQPKPVDLKKNYLQYLETLGAQVVKQPILDHHRRGQLKIDEQNIPIQYDYQQRKKEGRWESDDELKEKESGEWLNKSDTETETEKEKNEIELVIEPETETGEEKVKPEPRIMRRRLNNEFKLKKVKDEITFDSPQGEISSLFYNKYVQQKTQIAEHNQEILEQYAKGEQKIDRRNVDPRYRTKLQQLINMYALEEEQEKYDLDDKVITRDTYQTVAKLKRYRKQIELKEEKGDAEAFWELVESYPGSRYGPLPEDDPEFFYKYIKGRIPGSVKEKYRRETGQFLIDEQSDEKNPKEQKEEARRDHSFKKAIKRSPLTFRNILAENRFKEQEVYLENNRNLSGMSTTFNLEENVLPVLPEFEVKDYQSNWQVWLMWQKFRYFYGLLHQDQIFGQIHNFVSQCNYATMTIKPLASLNNYYQTLPKFLRQHEGVRTVYLGLEYKCPEWTVSEKEQALNKAALLCLPLEQSCDLMMQQHFSMDKYRLSAYEIDRIHNIKPEFTYDDEDFFNEIREEKLRGDKVGEVRTLPVVDEFPYGVPKSEAPSLPVDFYDNADGFWNSYIKDKSNRGAPVMKGRKYFRH